MADASLHSLHASPVTNVAAQTVTPSSDDERVVEFTGSPDAATYLGAVARSVESLASGCDPADAPFAWSRYATMSSIVWLPGAPGLVGGMDAIR